MTLGYLALVGIFFAMIAALFAMALVEIRRPSDPGPLPIDVGRDIEHRWFARLLRGLPMGDVHTGDDTDPHHAPQLIYGAATGPATFMMRSNGDVPDGGTLDAFVCDGVATVGPGATVLEHVDGADGLVIGEGAAVGGRATSATWILLAPGSRVRYAAAPHIMTDGPAVPSDPVPLAAWDGSFDVDLEWLLSEGMPLDQALRSLSRTAGGTLSGIGAVHALERRTGLGSSTIDLAAAVNPWWLQDAHGWYLGAATARIPGDLVLPAGAVVPFHLIVDGTLVARDGAHFHGGVSVGGDAILFDECRVEGSLTAKGSVLLGDRASVGECVSAGGDATLGACVLIGGGRNGGLASTGSVALGPGVRVTNKIYADAGIAVDDAAVYSPLPERNIDQSSPTGTYAP
ncbi:MAG TPA: hypothetical protein VGB64_05680 [Actinomycetota bacterium]